MTSKFQMKQHLTSFGLSMLFILLSYSLHGQKYYEKGQITFKDGTTKEGLIDKQKWRKSPSTVTFLDEIKDETSEYTTDDLRSFQVNGTKFETGNIEILDTESKELKKMDVFLRLIHEGKLDLYHAALQGDYPHFYFKRNGVFELLHNNEYYAQFNIKQRGSLKEQLVDILDECTNFKQNIEEPIYDENYLSDLMKSYQTCDMNDNSEFIYDVPSISYSLFLGGVRTSLDFVSETSNFYLVQTEFIPSITAIFGGTIDLPITNDRAFHSFNVDLLFTYSNFYGDLRIEGLGTTYTTNITEIDVSYLKLAPKYRFTFRNQPTTKVFANFGFSLAANLGFDSYRKRTNVVGEAMNSTEGIVTNEPNLIDMGLLGGIGYGKNTMGIEYRFEISTGFLQTISYSSQVKRHYFILSYTF